MKERKGMALDQTVILSDLDRLTKGLGARFEMLGGPRRVELGQATQYNTHIVTRHAARDRAVGCAPFERPLEESDRLFKVCAGLTEIGERGGEVVKDSGSPAGLVRRRERFERLLEADTRTSKIRSRSRVAEENRQIVEKPAAVLGGWEGQRGKEIPEVTSELGRRL